MAGPGQIFEILGAVKVKDGLFIGDEYAAKDLEFVVANKVTRVINCCGRQVSNHWEPIGVVYLTYFWLDVDNQVIIDQRDGRDVVANEIFRFIEEALEAAESILIHSVRGQSRSCCVLAAYMMRKYQWGLRKTMDFLSSRRPDINIKPAFLQQLSGYERRLAAQCKRNLSLDWADADFSRLENEDLLLRNTYINSQMGPLAELHSGESAKPPKLVWYDNNSDDKARLEKPAGADRFNLQSCKRNPKGQPILKCALKKTKPAMPGSKNSEQMSFASRPTTASSDNTEFQQRLGESIDFSLGKPPHKAVPHIAPSAGGPYVQPELVPTAWAADGGGPRISQAQGGTGVGPMFHEPIASAPPQPGYQPQAAPMLQLPPRGPATYIRDSLSGLPSRRESPEPTSSRPGSRDPSPKTSMDRRDSSLYRGESPLKLLSRSGRSGSPAGGAPPSRQSVASNPPFLAFGFSNIRSGPASCSRSMAVGSTPTRGMGQYRSGGPVRAKVDLLGEGSRRSRPATAPTTRITCGGGSRPASPLGAAQRSSSTSSRPSSPMSRAPSPAAPPPSRGMPGAAGYPLSQLDKSRQRSLSSHMRRAPSPTPAFNRNPSPSRPQPRWRS